MEKIRPIAKKLLAELKRRWWYIFLLISSTGYVWVYRFTIYQTPEITAQNIIFVLWLALLAVPLFSEIEIGSVKLKREIEQTRSEVKESIGDLKNQIVEMRVSNINSFTFGTISPLPTKDELKESEQCVVQPEYIPSEKEMPIQEESIYLFKVRYILEKKLNALCDTIDHTDRRSLTWMIRGLRQKRVIPPKVASCTHRIINIANRGVHGEIVDDEYLEFVKRIFPAVVHELDNALEYNKASDSMTIE